MPCTNRARRIGRRPRSRAQVRCRGPRPIVRSPTRLRPCTHARMHERRRRHSRAAFRATYTPARSRRRTRVADARAHDHPGRPFARRTSCRGQRTRTRDPTRTRAARVVRDRRAHRNEAVQAFRDRARTDTRARHLDRTIACTSKGRFRSARRASRSRCRKRCRRAASKRTTPTPEGRDARDDRHPPSLHT